MDRDTSLIRLIKRKAFGDSDIINFTDVTTQINASSYDFCRNLYVYLVCVLLL